MSASSLNSIRSPNLIFIAPSPGWLDVVACAESRRGLQIAWQARQPLGDEAAFFPRLADILKQHAVHPHTRAVMIAPPGVGGLLVNPAIENACRNPAWCRRQLELALPYPLAEIRYGMRCIGAQIQFFWVPQAWLDSQKSVLQKFGLKLEEVLPRALLFEAGASAAATEVVLSERFQSGELLYCLRGGHVHQAVALPPELDGPARTAYLNGMAAGHAAPIAEAAAALPAWAERLPELWRDAELAIALDTTTASLWRPFFRLALAVAAVTMALAGFLAWETTRQEETLAAALRESKSLAQSVKRFQELERSLREEGAVVAAVGQMNRSPTPLPLLAQFTKILPKEAWVQHLVFDGKSMVVSGKGIGDDALSKLLQGANLEAIQMRQEPAAETNDFRLRVLGKEEAATGGTP